MQLTMSSSPHVHTRESISSIMLDVLIALMPAVLAGIFFFGYRASLVLLTAVAACLLSEYAYEKIMKKPVTVRDLSAVVTGVLLGLNMPPSVPLWMVVAGSAFAMILVKQLYGGLGKNFMNPALAARCFMLIAWPSAMTTFHEAKGSLDAVSSATPLAVLKGISEGALPSLSDSLIGRTAGCIGETSAVLLLLGFLYLLLRKVVRIRIPAAMLGSFAVLTYFFGNNTTEYSQSVFTLMHLLNGGLLLGAFFMATDYVTTPTTRGGQIVFGLGCGILTFVIRRFGGYPEGTSFAILLMNVAAPLIESAFIPKTFGEVKKNG